MNSEQFSAAVKMYRDMNMVAHPHIPVFVLHYTGEQRRRHRKRRINKKWLKRYGVYEGPLPCKDYWFVWDGSLFTTRPTYQKIRGEITSARKFYQKDGGAL